MILLWKKRTFLWRHPSIGLESFSLWISNIYIMAVMRDEIALKILILDDLTTLQCWKCDSKNDPKSVFPRDTATKKFGLFSTAVSLCLYFRRNSYLLCAAVPPRLRSSRQLMTELCTRSRTCEAATGSNDECDWCRTTRHAPYGGLHDTSGPVSGMLPRA